MLTDDGIDMLNDDDIDMLNDDVIEQLNDECQENDIVTQRTTNGAPLPGL